MDIGVPSVRNIKRIAWPRKLLWCLLFLSSVPVHLMYNSVIISSTSTTHWMAVAVTSNFLTAAPFHEDEGIGYDDSMAPRLGSLRNSTSLVRLENDKCIAAYDKTIISAWSDVLLISTQPSSNNSIIRAAPDYFVSWGTTGASNCVISYPMTNLRAA